jgi:ribosomal protein L34
MRGDDACSPRRSQSRAGRDAMFDRADGAGYCPRPDPRPRRSCAAIERPVMKLKVRRSKAKRLKKVGFRTRSKTTGGRKVIKRKIKRSGKFRVG